MSVKKVKLVKAKDRQLTVSLGRSPNVVIFNELLLLANHVLQVYYGAGLQLQIKKQLDVLRL